MDDTERSYMNDGRSDPKKEKNEGVHCFVSPHAEPRAMLMVLFFFSLSNPASDAIEMKDGRSLL